jgi:hypothetical protein
VASFEDHYRTLGVHRHAKPTVIAAAYRAMAREYHPDLHRGNRSAENRLKHINAAYAVLADPTKRRSYDREWDAHHAPPQTPPPQRPASEKSPSPPPKQPPPAPPPTPRQKAERRGRPWYVNLIGTALVILVIRAVAGSGGESAPTTSSRPARPASLAPTATLRPGTGQIDPPTTITPTPQSITGVLGYPWGFAEPFADTLAFEGRQTDLVSSHIGADGLAITIKAPGGLDTYVYDALPSEGRDSRFRIDVASTDGWGEIALIVAALGGDPEWTFSVDPAAQEWSLYRTSASTNELFYWVEPRPYANLVSGEIATVEVQVIGGNPALWLNGKNVVEPFGIAMPEMPGSLFFGFGAGINPYSLTGYGQSFTVIFERAELREL